MNTKASRAETSRPSTDFAAKFFSYLAQRQLRYPVDPRTGEALGFSRRQCTRSPGVQPEWRLASGEAELFSYTIYHRSYSDAFPAPYNVSLIRLREGPTLIGTVAVNDHADLHIGMKLAAEFRHDGRLVFVPREWRKS